ncbi:TonB dependent receptor [Hymenobacter actinosclerus]|uniref:Outer membrane receptor proteins, mostly Fe transport n=1 Tax=Hymenobacter actinosclerus TaxID=82805 RepID=A0A1I0IIL9_9BACT|nr:TonB dependent receptor [Hymenobacter actinosclerus]SET96850.1 Outer membrane receptor proteins, mostly Fe transport [Hymenobacter actinosclerus]
MKSLFIVVWLLCGLLLLPSAGWAQQASGTVVGTVIDKNQKPVPYATVVLRKVGDLNVAKIALTDTEGGYELADIGYGHYALLVTSIGYQEATSEPFDLNQEQQKGPTVLMVEIDHMLGEVRVTAQKPLVERQLDRTIINVDASITNAGSNVLEVLAKSPGVAVDKDGNIALRGKEGVTVYIDGRPTYLSGTDLAAMLRSMQSNQLSQVEIMTNPSAKYDAAGNGVINIKTVRSQVKGFSGTTSVAYTQGRYYGVVPTANLNYRKDALTLYGSLGAGVRKGYQDFYSRRRLQGLSGVADTALYEQNTYMRTSNQTFNAKLGLDYALGRNTLLGVSVNGYHNPNRSSTDNHSGLLNSNNQLLSAIESPAQAKGRWQNLGGSLNLQHTFDTTGRELSADLAYVQYHSALTQNFTNLLTNPEDGRVLSTGRFRQGIDRSIAIYTARTDYVQPLGSARKLELGLKASYVSTDNDAPYASWNTGVWTDAEGRSNRFLYKENINAAYAAYNQETGAWTLQLGLRLEQTHARGEQRRTGQAFTRNYTQLFPSTLVGYKLNDNNQLGLSYGRRIERPEYGDLNPFRVYLDQYTYEEGNPLLQPQFSHNAELTHTLKEGLLTTTLLYSRTADIIQDVFRQEGKQAFERPENLSSRLVRGISVSTELPIGEVLTSTLDAQLTNTQFRGRINDQPFAIGATTFKGNVLNQVKLDNGWGFELAGWYTSRSVAGTFIQRPFGMVAVGISKAILEKRGTLRLSATDLFATNRFEGVSQYQGVDVYLRNTWQSRAVKLNFTYRFNRGEKVKIKERRSASEEENNRVSPD